MFAALPQALLWPSYNTKSSINKTIITWPLTTPHYPSPATSKCFSNCTLPRTPCPGRWSSWAWFHQHFLNPLTFYGAHIAHQTLVILLQPKVEGSICSLLPSPLGLLSQTVPRSLEFSRQKPNSSLLIHVGAKTPWMHAKHFQELSSYPTLVSE